jgi:hypothetical protein
MPFSNNPFLVLQSAAIFSQDSAQARHASTHSSISDALATAAQARQVSLCKFELLMRNFALVAQISVQSSISR